ncbi:MAG: hypothetical protein K8R88_09935 [Armatimonadetes bacterium]|nr:hypothetical protein [Armatimonadota bacterium]
MIRTLKRELPGIVVKIEIEGADYEQVVIAMLASEISAGIERIAKATAKEAPAPSGCRGCGDA